MKYIRTKDGIWEYIDEYESVLGDEYVLVVWADSFRGEKVFEKEEIIKQADTIEELCDELVFFNKIDGHKRWFFDKRWKEDCLLQKKIRPTEIYGAIWTDKGLIYVAKMNEKNVMRG